MSDAEHLVRTRIRESADLAAALLEADVPAQVASAAGIVTESLRAGGKLLAFGNGGSASDAQHIVAELVGRYLVDRPPLAAVALAENSSIMTAIANDYSFGGAFARQVEALGKSGDVALGLSTSGDSENVVAGLRAAGERGLRTLAFTGASGGRLAQVAELCIRAPATSVPRIQEVHTLIGHALCELVERASLDG